MRRTCGDEKGRKYYSDEKTLYIIYESKYDVNMI